MDCFCSVEFYPFSIDKCRTHIRVISSYVYSFNLFYFYDCGGGGVAVVFSELQEETDLNKVFVYSPCLAKLLPCPWLSFFNQTGVGFDVIFSAPLLFRI